MYLALATLAEPLACLVPLPTLCGVYTSKEAAAAYCAWENARADGVVYYPSPVEDHVIC
jgi:hypothetical protein